MDLEPTRIETIIDECLEKLDEVSCYLLKGMFKHPMVESEKVVEDCLNAIKDKHKNAELLWEVVLATVGPKTLQRVVDVAQELDTPASYYEKLGEVLMQKTMIAQQQRARTMASLDPRVSGPMPNIVPPR